MAVKIDIYRWSGSFGPLKIKIPCGECSLTMDVVKDVIANELAGIAVELSVHDWLSEWWKPLKRGGWHAPIVVVNDKVISQGAALNRGVLAQAVVENHVQDCAIVGNHVFGKASCPHCKRAKQYLDKAGIEYEYHDVIKDTRALYEMLGRVKPLIGPKTPVTVPQIWLQGKYVGGADELAKIVKQKIKPNPERGQCSLSKPGLGGKKLK